MDDAHHAARAPAPVIGVVDRLARRGPHGLGEDARPVRGVALVLDGRTPHHVVLEVGGEPRDGPDGGLAREQALDEELVPPPVAGHGPDAAQRHGVLDECCICAAVLPSCHGHRPTPLLDRGRGHRVGLGQMFVKRRKWFPGSVRRPDLPIRRTANFSLSGPEPNHKVVVLLCPDGPAAGTVRGNRRPRRRTG